MKSIWIGLGVLVSIALAVFFYDMSVDNKEVKLQNQKVAQETVMEGYFDKMWKIIETQATVAKEYKNDFKEVYEEIIGGRYGDARGGALMSWITEHNPEFDSSLYTNLQNSIEAQREGFFAEQEILINVKQTHDNLRMVKPASWFVNDDVEEMEITIITSAKTKEVFETGEENDVDPFNRPSNTPAAADSTQSN